MSRIIDDFLSTPQDERAYDGFAYHYCRTDGANLESLLYVTTDLVHQLSSQKGTGEVGSLLYECPRTYRSEPSSTKLERCKQSMKGIIDLYPLTTILLDGVDEYNDDSRDELVEFLLKLLSETKKPLKIFLSSRASPGMQQKLQKWPQIRIQATDIQEDIAAYLDVHLSAPPHWARLDAALQDHVKSAILEKSNGM
jgi:hypothetical protein